MDIDDQDQARAPIVICRSYKSNLDSWIRGEGKSRSFAVLRILERQWIIIMIVISISSIYQNTEQLKERNPFHIPALLYHLIYIMVLYWFHSQLFASELVKERALMDILDCPIYQMTGSTNGVARCAYSVLVETEQWVVWHLVLENETQSSLERVSSELLLSEGVCLRYYILYFSRQDIN